jgi:hypothetical protein
VAGGDGVEPVVGFQPIEHLGGSVLKCLIEGTSIAHGKQLGAVGGDTARPADRPAPA